MATASEVMKIAEKYVGTKEKPSGSNNVIFNTHYYGKEVKGSSYPWCCAFVWDVFRMAGASSLFGEKTAYCPTYEQSAKKRGESVSKSKGQYGDVVTFDFGKGRAQHIGFIYKNLGNGMYETIEGNTSLTSDDNGGAVMKRKRSVNSMRYIFRPKYSAEKKDQKKEETKKSGNSLVKKGQKHSIAFTGHTISADGVAGEKTLEQGIRVLQMALNLDYKAKLAVDGVLGVKTKKALGKHYVKQGEKQYMVTACEILLYLKGYDAGGVKTPDKFDSDLKKVVKEYQRAHKLTVDGVCGRNTFLSLVK